VSANDNDIQPVEPVRDASSARTRAAVLLVVTFLGGIVLGAIGDRFMLFHQHRMLPRGGMRMAAEHIVHRLDRDLDLTPAQEKQVEASVKRHEQRMEASWSEMQPKVRAEMEQTDREIEAVLNPQQIKKFRDFRARMQHRARIFMGRHD
jgi:hypothetical protein